VANTRDNTATIIDGTTNSALATVKTGSGPYAIAVSSATDKAFVENLVGGTITVIDGKTLAGMTATMPTVK
jgi:YVTN family beta-propeller protein